MLNTSRLVAFVTTTNASAAQHFYGVILGLAQLEANSFAIVFDANGTTLRVQIVESTVAAPYTALGWEVDNIASTVQRLIRSGVSFEQFDSLAQDASGIWTTPDGAAVAWFKDPDGNLLSVTQRAQRTH